MKQARRAARERIRPPTSDAQAAQGKCAAVQPELRPAINESPRMLAQRAQLAAAFGPAVQREAAPDEDELQMKESPVGMVQRLSPEEEEPLQGRFSVAQRETGIEEDEEPLQGKFETAQRQGAEEDELQMKAAPAVPSQLEAEPAPPPNRTGLPDGLKTGIESLSGISLDEVRVHYGSSRPAQLNALAYAQGSDIHLAPGQEQHLPHEAWHVVQQAQGRVQPTIQRKDGVPVNDDEELEREADVMGAQAEAEYVSGRRQNPDPSAVREVVKNLNASTSVQRKVDEGLPAGTPVKHANGNGTVVNAVNGGYQVRLDSKETIEAKLDDLAYHDVASGLVHPDFSEAAKGDRRVVSGAGAKASGANMQALLDSRDGEGAKQALQAVFSASLVADAQVYQSGVNAVSRLCDMLEDSQWKQILVHTCVYFYKEEANIRLYKTPVAPGVPSGKASEAEPAGGWDRSRKTVHIGKADTQSAEQMAKTLLHEFTHLAIDSAYGNKGLPYKENDALEKEYIAFPGVLYQEWQERLKNSDGIEQFLKNKARNNTEATSAASEIRATLLNLQTYTTTKVSDFAIEVFSHYSEICQVVVRTLGTNTLNEFIENFFKETGKQFAGVVKTSEKSDYSKVPPAGAEAALAELSSQVEEEKLATVISGSPGMAKALRTFVDNVRNAFEYNNPDKAKEYLPKHVATFATAAGGPQAIEPALAALYPVAVATYGKRLGARLE